eukprot:m.233857 g.233857  ORF g.233857 m.233857 type:complete len:156 (-) comp12580_c0_seq1:93-560(-)
MPPKADSDDDDGHEFTLDSVVDHDVQYMGTIAGLQRSANELVDYIDNAKRMGIVAWQTSEEDSVKLLVSKYGLKVTDMRKQEVFARIPLHKVGSVLHYAEEANQHLVVVETGDTETMEYKYYIYKAASEAQARAVCGTFRQAFELVFQKSVVDNL